MTRSDKRLLFIDYNGVISYFPFWHSLRDPAHKLNFVFGVIQDFLFTKNKEIINDWMRGKYDSEHINNLITTEAGIKPKELWNVYVEDCKNMDISHSILTELAKLKKNYTLILRTDNMDCFERFTLPRNKKLVDTFDEIHTSTALKELKKDRGGKYFIETAEKYGLGIHQCFLIDDSSSNTEMFTSLGGKAFRTKTESEALDAISKLNLMS